MVRPCFTSRTTGEARPLARERYHFFVRARLEAEHKARQRLCAKWCCASVIVLAAFLMGACATIEYLGATGRLMLADLIED